MSGVSFCNVWVLMSCRGQQQGMGEYHEELEAFAADGATAAIGVRRLRVSLMQSWTSSR
jgi:hypothetical protein